MPTPDRLASALRFYRELKCDRSARHITARHLWELAYHRARMVNGS